MARGLHVPLFHHRLVQQRLYAKYRGLRVRLFDELCRRHSNIPADRLLDHAQRIVDRLLFLAFAQGRQLLPPNTIARAYEHRDPYHPRPIWQRLLALFRSVDSGNLALGIPLYSGGLFREVPELEDLEVSDETCAALKELGDYDFADDVSVEVLGHIFEQSISDLEQLRRDAKSATTGAQAPSLPTTGTQRAPSQRKREGIFYSPAFVTSYLVRKTLSQVTADAWERSGAAQAKNRRERIEAWERYRSQLRLIRILDPACGSGAFLIAAFDAMAQEYGRVNRALAELRGEAAQTSSLDLTRTVLSENLFGVDMSTESVEITKLSLWLKTAERDQQQISIARNIRHGNSVVSDPRIDPWAFDWNAGQVARSFEEPRPPAGEDADAIAARWRDGFDVVIGNPPYVRHELLTPYKEHWQQSFEVYDGVADLFVYFFELGIKQLKPGGMLGFLVSNKWLRGGYAEELRQFLAGKCTIENIVDFGHAPIFRDADAFPCIITLRKLAPKPEHTVSVTQYPREALGKELLASYIESHQFPLPQAELRKTGWQLDPPAVRALLDKLRRNGVPLGEYAQSRPYYGIKTGCNEAFLIDQDTKERLCREDPGSAQVLKKYLRGQDIARWSPEWAGMWIVLLQSSGDQQWPWSHELNETSAERIFAQTFPAIYGRCKPLEDRLRQRTDRGLYWWELRSCAYYELFERPRLLYPDILWRSGFCLAPGGTYTNNTTYLLPSEDTWLLGCLNAPAVWSLLWRTAQHAKDEALRMFSDFLVTVPIATPVPLQKEAVAQAVSRIADLTRHVQTAGAGVMDLLAREYGVETPSKALADFATLGSDGFVREVKRRRDKDGAPLSPAGLSSLRSLFEAEAPGILEKRAQILTQELTIAAAVHAAYRLTDEELQLLRQTQPPRMPPGW